MTALKIGIVIMLTVFSAVATAATPPILKELSSNAAALTVEERIGSRGEYFATRWEREDFCRRNRSKCDELGTSRLWANSQGREYTYWAKEHRRWRFDKVRTFK